MFPPNHSSIAVDILWYNMERIKKSQDKKEKNGEKFLHRLLLCLPYEATLKRILSTLTQ